MGKASVIVVLTFAVTLCLSKDNSSKGYNISDLKCIKQFCVPPGYNKHVSAMVFNVEQKSVAHTIKEMPRDGEALIDAQKMMGVNDAVHALRPMLDGKYDHLSLMMTLASGSTTSSSATQRETCGVWRRRCQRATRLPRPSCQRTARLRCN